MFECKYKFELEDSLISAKYVYKSQRRKMDKVITALIPILIVIMVAMLTYDIVKKRSLVLDIILLVALIVLEALYLIVPLLLARSQKKSYYKQKLDEMDYLYIKIEDNLCTETLFKDEQEVAKNIHSLKSLTSYLEDNSRLILVFNKIEFVCIKKDNLKGSLDKLKNCLNKAMAKQNAK